MSWLFSDPGRWKDDPSLPINPYFQKWLAVSLGQKLLDDPILKLIQSQGYALSRMAAQWLGREKWVHEYAWAIPCEEALRAIGKYGPLVEMGAGTGYWASLLEKRGVEVTCYDECPPPHEDNHWHRENVCHHMVWQGGSEMVKEHPDKTLFLCWPPMSRMAEECLDHYRGPHVVYIGERHGCTGTEELENRLEKEWVEIEEVEIPQYDGIHDYLRVFKRK